MNAFTDLHVSFGKVTSPHRQRLGNPWQQIDVGAPGVWIGTASSTRSDPVSSAQAHDWQLWASGSVFSYRDDESTPLERFTADLAAGCAAPDQLDMHAVIFGWQDAPRELSVWTDRMGTVHAYRGGSPGRAAVGTFSPAVAEASSGALDWTGITGFCGFGFYPGDRTMHEDVRILRPATHTVFDERGAVVHQARYWDWWYDPDHSRSDEDFIDEFHELWTRTIQRQLRGTRAVVPLSGGLDSRTVFAVAAPRDHMPADPVRTLTYGYSATSPEIRISRRVAAARGHSAVELVVEPYLLDRLPEVLDAVEGFQSLAFSRQVGASGTIAALGDHVVGGHWGDVWFDTATAHTGSSLDLVAAAHQKSAKRGREWLLEYVCRPHLGGRDPEVLLRELIEDELTRLPELDDVDMRLKVLKIEQWSFRWTLASIRAYQLAVPTILPFYANGIVDFFLHVPSERLPGRRLQTAYLRRHHPDLARITWQDTGMSLFERRWEPVVALARRVLAKGMRTLRREHVIERNWEVQYLGDHRPEQVLGFLRSAGSVSAGLAADDLHRFMAEFRNTPDSGRGYALDALLTLSRVIRQLNGSEPTHGIHRG